jgi:hypothetical protein
MAPYKIENGLQNQATPSAFQLNFHRLSKSVSSKLQKKKVHLTLLKSITQKKITI